jgi:hypothetical protein
MARPRPAALFAVAAGLVASAASTPSAGDGVFGASDTFIVLLDGATPEVEQRVRATLNAGVEIGADGEIGLTALFDETDVGQVNLVITSDTTGEFSETSVLDTAAQPQISVGIPAFVGCSGLEPCEEELIIRFERLETDVTNDLEFEWELDGSVSILDAEAENVGSLTFTPE